MFFTKLSTESCTRPGNRAKWGIVHLIQLENPTMGANGKDVPIVPTIHAKRHTTLPIHVLETSDVSCSHSVKRLPHRVVEETAIVLHHLKIWVHDCGGVIGKPQARHVNTKEMIIAQRCSVLILAHILRN